MLSRELYEKYKRMKHEFEQESMRISEEIARLSGYDLNDKNSEPLWENRRPYFHLEEMMREEMISGIIYYNYQTPPSKEMLKQKDEDFDFCISCSFPARYLWQTNWENFLGKDRGDGLLLFDIAGNTGNLISNDRISILEMTDSELRETFEQFHTSDEGQE
jgi:hypothetical protein